MVLDPVEGKAFEWERKITECLNMLCYSFILFVFGMKSSLCQRSSVGQSN
jgi:hypothetical protein